MDGIVLVKRWNLRELVRTRNYSHNGEEEKMFWEDKHSEFCS
jgi:hypothetical protein